MKISYRTGNNLYSEKLKSPKWQKKRLLIMNRDNFKCQKCGGEEKMLHVHHKRYLKGLEPWEYEDVDLVTLCEDCHAKEHNNTVSEKVNTIGPTWSFGDPVYIYEIGDNGKYTTSRPRTGRHLCELISQIIYELLASFDYIGCKYHNWITSEEWNQINCAAYECEYKNEKVIVSFCYGSNSGNGYNIFNNIHGVLNEMISEQNFELPSFQLNALKIPHRFIHCEETFCMSDFVQGHKWFTHYDIDGCRCKFIDDDKLFDV